MLQNTTVLNNKTTTRLEDILLFYEYKTFFFIREYFSRYVMYYVKYLKVKSLHFKFGRN